MPRSTVGETLQRIRRQLSASQRMELDTLNTTVNTSTTTIVLASTPPAGLRKGSLISIDLETMRLTADPSGNNLTVMRGFMDSDAAAHTAGAEVWINPEFHPIDLIDDMIDEIQSWGPDLYRVVGETFTVADDDLVHELPVTYAGTYGLVDVRRKRDSALTGESWETWPRVEYRFQRGTATGWTGVTTSGLLIRVLEPVAGSLFVMLALPFVTSTFTEATDLVATVGLQESMLDLLAMGVKMRRAFDREMAEQNRGAQDDPRRAAETPPGAAVTPMQFGRAMYVQRRMQEVAKLRALYPIRHS